MSFLLCSLPYIQQVDTKKLSIVSNLTGLSMVPRADIYTHHRLRMQYGQSTVCPSSTLAVDNQLFEDRLVYLGSEYLSVVIEVSSVDLLNSLPSVW